MYVPNMFQNIKCSWEQENIWQLEKKLVHDEYKRVTRLNLSFGSFYKIIINSVWLAKILCSGHIDNNDKKFTYNTFRNSPDMLECNEGRV